MAVTTRSRVRGSPPRQKAQQQKAPPRKKGEPKTCACLSLKYTAGFFWNDPLATQNGTCIQRLGQMNVFQLTIQVRLLATLTCGDSDDKPLPTCSGKIECKVLNANFTDKDGAALAPMVPGIVVPPSQTVTNDCDGKEKDLVAGYTAVFLFLAPQQNNPQPRPPGVGNRDLIINGDINLEFELKECAGGLGPPIRWRMRLKIKDSSVDKDESDYDGDGKKNKDEPAPGATPQEKESNKKKNMFNPAVN